MYENCKLWILVLKSKATPTAWCGLARFFIYCLFVAFYSGRTLTFYPSGRAFEDAGVSNMSVHLSGYKDCTII